MRVLRWVVTGVALALLAGFVAGFVGALLAPRRPEPRTPRSVEA